MSEKSSKRPPLPPHDAPCPLEFIVWALDGHDAYEAAEKRIADLARENDRLCALLGSSAKDCMYCGLPATEQAKCARGFPGCARADDQMLSAQFADGWRAEQAEQQLADQRRALAALMIKHSFATGHGDTHADLLRELDRQLTEAAARGGVPCVIVSE